MQASRSGNFRCFTLAGGDSGTACVPLLVPMRTPDPQMQTPRYSTRLLWYCRIQVNNVFRRDAFSDVALSILQPSIRHR